MIPGLVAPSLAGLRLLLAVVTGVKAALPRRRIVPVNARILNLGQTGSGSAADLARAGNQAENHRRAPAERDTPDTNLRNGASPSYAGHWEYGMAVCRCQTGAVPERPVVIAERARAGRAQVFHNRRNRALSMVRPGDTAQAMDWVVGAGAVGLLLLAIFDQTGGAAS